MHLCDYCTRRVSFQFVHRFDIDNGFLTIGSSGLPMRVFDLNSDQGISFPSAEVKARQPLPRWLLLLAPVTSTCALGVLGFAYAAV